MYLSIQFQRLTGCLIMMKKIRTILLLTLLTAGVLFAQSESAFGPAAPAGQSEHIGLLDPSRFTVNHAMSFSAGGQSFSNMRSQSVYSTMFQYRFDAPVVLRLNFDMPLHSTFNSAMNFSKDNISSMDYFKNMPIDASLSWQPSQNFMFSVAVIKQPYSYSPHSFYRPGSAFFRHGHERHRILAD